MWPGLLLAVAVLGAADPNTTEIVQDEGALTEDPVDDGPAWERLGPLEFMTAMRLVGNCSECETPSEMKYSSSRLPVPALDFPEAPVIVRDLATPRMSLSQGLTQFKHLRNFLSYIQPNEFPIDLLRDYMMERISMATLVASALQVDAGFICCLVIGVIVALVAPGVALGRLCYRVTNQVTVPDPGCIGNCKRRTLVFFTEILLAFLLVGVSGMLASNEQASSAVLKVPTLVESVAQDGLTFISDTHTKLHHLVTASIERTIRATSQDLDNVENLLGRPIQAELARETGLDVALETLMDVEKEAVGVCRQVSIVMQECSEAEQAGSTTGDRLRELRHQVESTLRHCQAKDRPLCDTIGLNGLDLRFSTQPIMSDAQMAYLRQQNLNLSSAVAEATNAFQGLPSSVQRETKEARNGVFRLLSRHKVQLGESVRSLELFAREISHKIENTRESMIPYFSSIEQADFWIWLVGLGAGLSILHVWLLLLGAISCGCCGAEKGSVPTLVMTIILISILSAVLWLLAISVMFAGGHGEVFLCRPLFEEDNFRTITKLADEPGIIYLKKGGFMPNFLYDNGSIEMPLRGCHRERLIYRLTALELKVGPLQRQVNQSLAHLKTIQYFINNQWSTIAHQNVKDYTARLNNYLQQFQAYLHNSINGSSISCRPLWELFQSTRTLLCRNIMDPINGFWFATLWCLIIFLMVTPVNFKLLDFYRQQRRFQGELQRDGDGW